jgi:methylenetetrahydrofolate reductase (NADPH)
VHLPGINLTKSQVLKTLDDLREAGIENILALRGDVDPSIEPKGDFKHASDLISFIKENGDFNIIAACYPEGHVECPSVIEDIRNLKAKVDAGADHLITQLFFDNSYFYSFLERVAIAGINVPIQAGIMPATNKKQIERIVSLCGVSLPKKFLYVLNRYEDHPEAMRDAGIAYAVDQIVDLIAQGADGIHLYTMNEPYVALRICEAINALLVA